MVLSITLVTAYTAYQIKELGDSESSDSHDIGIFSNDIYISNCDQPRNQKPFNVRDIYEIQDVLGEGAFGKVFKARRKSDGKPIALKAMPTEYSSSDDFQREIVALEELSQPGHDHVCKLYSQHIDNTKGYFFLALELIPGGELFEYLISQGPFSEQDAAKFLKQFSQALTYIHSKGFVHADLKPENLMMGSGKLKVVDFGCARSDIDNNDTNENLVFGTTAYLPPETLANRHNPPTPAVDCFAAGVIMYIVLSGSHPFDPSGEATEEEIRRTIIECGQSPGYYNNLVFEDGRVRHLSQPAIQLIKALLQPNADKRMTSEEFQNHPWIRGEAAPSQVMKDSHVRLKRFWQKRFRAAIVRNFGFSSSDCTDDALRKIFRSMDIDGNGIVDIDELKLALKDVAEEYMEDILQSLDTDGDGRIDFDEFRTVMKTNWEIQHQATANKQLREHVTLRIREIMMQNKQHVISTKELIRIFNSIKKSSDDRTIHISTLLQFLKGLGLEEEEIVAWVGKIVACAPAVMIRFDTQN